MKNILKKIITVYVIVAAIAILFKVGDNLLAEASTSNTSDQCGVNNGWIWNGSQCVNTCDQNHPWDPSQQKCSNGYNYVYNYNYGYGTNCAAAYGSNFYFNGTSCVQIVSGQNAAYYGNPYNGGTTNPVYVNGNNVNSNYVYTIPNYVPNYVNNNYISTSCGDSCYQNPAPRVNTTYYEYTITTTTYNPGGTPIYLGNNNCFNGCYNNNYNYSYNYPSYYNDGYYCDTGYYNIGYYDIYGGYHY